MFFFCKDAIVVVGIYNQQFQATIISMVGLTSTGLQSLKKHIEQSAGKSSFLSTIFRSWRLRTFAKTTKLNPPQWNHLRNLVSKWWNHFGRIWWWLDWRTFFIINSGRVQHGDLLYLFAPLPRHRCCFFSTLGKVVSASNKNRKEHVRTNDWFIPPPVM